jgi:hypothetical protein
MGGGIGRCTDADGLKLDPDKVIEKMGAVVAIDGGSKWYLPDFVAFQYGQLNPANRVHASAFFRTAAEAVALTLTKGSKISPLQAPYKGLRIKIRIRILREERNARANRSKRR